MDKNLAPHPLVSVIMPAFNAAHFIAGSIASLQAQTYTKWELIVIDDGSTDHTAQIVQDLRLPQTKLRYITTQNAGPGAARNRGIKEAKGELIAFLDADDLWEPFKLELQLAAMHEGGYDVVCSSGRFIGDPTHAPFVTAKGPFSGAEMFAVLYQHNRVPIVSVLTKKAAVLKVGGFKEDGILARKCEDYDLWLRMANAGYSFLGMSEQLIGYRLHADSSTHQTVTILQGDLEAISQFEDAMRKQDPMAYRQRMADIYDRLAAAQAADRDLAAAKQSLATLATFEPSWRTLPKKLALMVFGRRYNAVYHRLITQLP